MLKRIPKDTVLQGEICKPLFVKKDPVGVLLIHGYTGSPHDMRYLAEKLVERGFTVSVPRLPGHGTNHMDFLSTNHRDWLRRAIDAHIELRTECEKVHVVGLSMGGLLAAILATKFEVEKLVLAAPAFVVSDKRVYITPILALFKDYLPREERVEYEDPVLKKLGSEYWNKNFTKPAVSFLKLKRLATRLLGQVRSKTLLIIARNDSVVPMEVREFVEKRVKGPIETVVLEKSNHVVVNDVEKEYVAQLVAKFLEE
ncbi:alpha/beta hydrolase [Pseudothermotoga thermarum]|nr:alpha/beta fold hydrolase [Pseudothermotoga thermarum]